MCCSFHAAPTALTWTSRGGKAKSVTALEYYCWRLMQRDGRAWTSCCAAIIGCSSSRPYVVDACAKIEQQRLNYLRFNQNSFRTWRCSGEWQRSRRSSSAQFYAYFLMRSIEHDEYILLLLFCFLCFDLTLLRYKKCIEVAFLPSWTTSTQVEPLRLFELIFKQKRVTVKMLPWGTPVSCSCGFEYIPSTLALNCRIMQKASNKKWEPAS